jgi:hypothetical protein
MAAGSQTTKGELKYVPTLYPLIMIGTGFPLRIKTNSVTIKWLRAPLTRHGEGSARGKNVKSVG